MSNVFLMLAIRGHQKMFSSDLAIFVSSFEL